MLLRPQTVSQSLYLCSFNWSPPYASQQSQTKALIIIIILNEGHATFVLNVFLACAQVEEICLLPPPHPQLQ